MSARDVYAASVASAHASAQTGAIAVAALPNSAALPGNLSGWSRASVNAAFQNGSLTAAQAQRELTSISQWESAQRDVAADVLRATGDTGPA